MSDEPDGLQISTVSSNGGHVVRVAGEVDLRTSPRLRTLLLQVIDTRPKRLIVDLAGVEYMDSSGVGTMVEIKRMLEGRGGEIVLVGLQPRVRGVFEITQLDKFFRIVNDLAEASD